MGSTTTTCVAPSRPDGEAVVVGCTSLHGVASWGVGGGFINNTPLVLKGCMTVVALPLILQCVFHCWPRLKGGGGGGKMWCHWWGSTYQVRGTVDGGGILLLRTLVVVIPLLLVMAGDVETNPGPPKMEGKKDG